MTVPPNADTLRGAIESKMVPGNSAAIKSTMTSWCSSKWRPILAEFLATLILVMMGCMTAIPFEGQNSALYSPLGFGFIVMINIQMFGHISGAHMNPAVTLAGIIWGNMTVVLGIAYFLAQVCGAIVGYGILTMLSPIDLTPGAVCVTMPIPDINIYRALGIEVALTFVLSFINCALWDPVNNDKNETVPIKFSLIITGLSLVGGPWTGASMNPARSLGPAVLTGIWTVHWIYWVGPFVGSGVAALLYKFVFLKKRDFYTM